MEENTEENTTETKQESEEKSKTIENLTEKLRENPWMVSTLVLGLVCIILLFTTFSGGITGNVISANEAGQKLLKFYEASGAQGLSIKSVEEENGLYKVNFMYQGATVPIYMTKDGNLAGSLNQVIERPQVNQEQQPQEIPKSNKPIVELFVMTHCPYGTQAEKGFVPAIKTLGDKIDASVKFVHYFLHAPEETETPIQICIREEQGDKFINYLECFLKDGDSKRCQTEVKINKATLDKCIEENYEEYYNTDSALSQGYGVRGSPTLVINGMIADSGRSSTAYLQTICSAFNEAPEECSETLSGENPSPGFGYSAGNGGSTSTGNAQC